MGKCIMKMKKIKAYPAHPCSNWRQPWNELQESNEEKEHICNSAKVLDRYSGVLLHHLPELLPKILRNKAQNSISRGMDSIIDKLKKRLVQIQHGRHYTCRPSPISTCLKSWSSSISVMVLVRPPGQKKFPKMTLYLFMFEILQLSDIYYYREIDRMKGDSKK